MSAKETIYADNAATTRLDPIALEAMLPFLRDSYGNPSSLYRFGNLARNALTQARERIAACIGAETSEIFFTSGGTESDNWALKGIAQKNRGKGKHMIVSAIEHHAILNSAKRLEEEGCQITYLPVDGQGVVSPEILKKAIRSDTVLVSIMTANNEIGTIQDSKVLSQIAHEQGILFHTDAVQAIGHIPIDVRKMDVDLLSASAHKFNGPKGIGFLYIKTGTPIMPFMNGGQQENGLRAGTENLASIVGMSVALEQNTMNLSMNIAHLNKLAIEFKRQLAKQIHRIKFNGSPDCSLPGLISLSIPACTAEGLMHILDMQGIAVSTGAACDSKNMQISHVLKAIGLSEQQAKGTLRVSFGKDTTLEECLRVASLLIHFSSLQ